MRMQTKLLLSGSVLAGLSVLALCWPQAVTALTPAPAPAAADTSRPSVEAMAVESRSASGGTVAAPARTLVDEDNREPRAAGAPAAGSEAETASLVVHVVDERGRPVAGADVFLAEQEGQGSDVDAIHTGSVDLLKALVTDKALAEANSAAVSPPTQGEAAELRFEAVQTMRRVFVLSSAQVRVSGSQGVQFLNWDVFVGDSWRDDGVPPKLTPLGTTDAAGRCRVAAARGSTLLSTTAARWSSGLVESGDDSVQGDDGEVVLAVRPPCRIEGLVVDAAGRALAGARVDARASGRTGAAHGRSIAGVAADAAGRFQLALDAVATFELQARHGEARSEVLSLDARARTEERVRIRMLEAVALRGIVRDPQGAPVEGASVRVRRADADPGADRFAKPLDATGASAADGAFEVLLPGAGSYSLAASHEAWAPSVPVLAAAGARGAAEVVVQLRAWAAMSGTVRWDDGTPLAGASLTARPEPEPGAGDVEPAGAETGPDGAFAFPHLLGDVRYELTCTPDPALPHTKVVRGPVWPSVQDFVLEREALRGASVRIRLLVPEGVRYEAGEALVSRRMPHGWVRGAGRHLAFDERHVATIDGLVRGATYAVELRGEYSRCRTEPFVAGLDPERTLRLLRPGKVSVVVREADGSPAFSATAILREDAPAGLRRDDAVRRTDRQGRAHWPSVSALPWLVLAARDGREGEPVRLLVEPDADHHVEVRLK